MSALPESDPQLVVPMVSAPDVLDLLGTGQRIPIIDLRTPKEFADDHLPGAINLPIFDNEERALIGTLYKRESPETAFQAGKVALETRIRDLFCEIAEVAEWDLPTVDLVERVDAMTAGGLLGLEEALATERVSAWPRGGVLLHCWRGGLRSRSVVALLRFLGLERAICLHRGYQSYRGSVIRELEEYVAPPTYTIRGYTGTGKTLVLREIEALRPGWTLDLEGCAGHRSSILGAVGLEPVSQKRFETRVADTLRHHSGPLVLEGESRKVGDLIQPASVWKAMQSSTNILLEATPSKRIDVLIEDYLAGPDCRAELREKLPYIEQRLGPKAWAGKLVDLLDRDDVRSLVGTLLEHYYDPLYQHSERGKEYALVVQMTDPKEAAAKIVGFIEAAIQGA